MKKTVKKIYALSRDVSNDHIGAYAAQSAYFFVLSLIPIILLLLTMVQYTPVTKADVMTAVIQVFPSSVDSLITSIVNQVYNQSSAIIPITVIVALWAAGKGVLAISTGLNTIYDCKETRNYFYLRVRATFYTVLFIIVILFLLVLSVFGDSLSIFITSHVPVLKPVIDRLMSIRSIVTPIVLIVFSTLIYTFLPNRKGQLRKQAPGAVFAAIAWLAISWFFSVYLDIFKGFSDMYGSLATIVLIMLWLYFCMYGILLGALLNKYWYEVVIGEFLNNDDMESDETDEMKEELVAENKSKS